ncbi:glucose-1-phosphate cytidylyltransferase [Paenibacillus sp. UASWS1643]|uniref:glucose-1-phosphate cytidylyltransferase n=1 Tax=Paenibacillus sp. UASWS1643 TaxID=2580422 RepID=UPI00123B4327|nr:glucose-1-phosphate cytidylyltransferase [Paenibacillus sp. UASWS1643]KAA8746136.1 glucose-1-phosphate cytidylyltransferase [Paenibacillus sp. UASWS1643]
MKTVILCGGLGTRLSEETQLRPKPMVEIGDMPILCHILHMYSAHGFHDFVLALGYKASYIKDYFLKYPFLYNDYSIDMTQNKTHMHTSKILNWKMDLLDTGNKTMTGGRIARLKPYLGNQTFMLTYGDGVGDVDLTELLRFHRSHGKLVTVTAVRPKSRFGIIRCAEDRVTSFQEKGYHPEEWINAGFFIMEPEVLRYIKGDDTELESEVLVRLAEMGQLMAYRHEGFWACMDTLRDKQELELLWKEGNAPWKIWD